MHWSKPVLSALAATTAASARPVSNVADPSMYFGEDGATDYSGVSDADGQSLLLSDVGSDSTTRSGDAASSFPPQPDQPAVVTISPSMHTSPRDPSPQKCLELYQKLLDHDPHLFDLAKCPVNGKSVMGDALSKCQEAYPLPWPKEQAKMAELVREFHKVMKDDCKEGERLLKDHHPIRDALYTLGELAAFVVCTGYCCKHHKEIREMIKRDFQMRREMFVGVALPDREEASDSGSEFTADDFSNNGPLSAQARVR